ncbi:MAG: pentapeptide repeat-containing protein [Prochlorotrichaceae cyanobacterium]
MKSKMLLWLYERGRRDFSGTRVEQGQFQRSNLRFACLSRSQLPRANFSHSLLIGADFVYTNLQSAVLVEANGIGGNFLAANLRRADLSRAFLAGAVFNSANLSQTNLSYAALNGAEMRAVNLQGANLQHANLQGANLRAANLYRANLTGANLDGADLSGAIMPDAEPEEYRSSEKDVLLTQPKVDLDPSSASRHYEPQTFEAIALEFDPNSNVASQKAIESEWGAAIDNADPLSEPTTIDFAQVPMGQWQDLLNDGLSRAFQFNTPEEAQGRLNRSLLLRKGAPQMRVKLLQAYDRRCAMSRCTVEEVLEAAYIVPYLGDRTNDPANLMLLRSDLHVLFDLHLLAIDPSDLTIRLAPWMKDTYYSILEGRSLHLPHSEDMRPDPDLLKQHWETCVWEHEEAWPTTYMF